MGGGEAGKGGEVKVGEGRRGSEGAGVVEMDHGDGVMNGRFNALFPSG